MPGANALTGRTDGPLPQKPSLRGVCFVNLLFYLAAIEAAAVRAVLKMDDQALASPFDEQSQISPV